MVFIIFKIIIQIGSTNVVVTTGSEGGGGAGSATGSKKPKLLPSHGSMETREINDTLAIAAAATQSQSNITQRRRERPGASNLLLKGRDSVPSDRPVEGISMPVSDPPQVSVIAGESIMKSSELKLMTPLLKFLQLLCENHNTKLQVRGGREGREGGREGGRERGNIPPQL